MKHFDIRTDAIRCEIKDGAPRLFFPDGTPLVFTTEIDLVFDVNNLPKAIATFILHCPDTVKESAE